MKQILLICAAVALVGCGKKEPVQPSATNPEATQSSATNPHELPGLPPLTPMPERSGSADKPEPTRGTNQTSILVSSSVCILKDGLIVNKWGGGPFSGRVGHFDDEQNLKASLNVKRGLVYGIDGFDGDGSSLLIRVRLGIPLRFEQFGEIFKKKTRGTPEDKDKEVEFSIFNKAGVRVLWNSFKKNKAGKPQLSGEYRNDAGKLIVRVSGSLEGGGNKIEYWYPNGSKRLKAFHDGKDKISGTFWDTEGKASSDLKKLKQHIQNFSNNEFRETAVKNLSVLAEADTGFDLFDIEIWSRAVWEFETGGLVQSSPAIGSDGTVYVGSWDHKLYAIKTDSKGLAKSPWPMRGQNARQTGRAPAK